MKTKLARLLDAQGISIKEAASRTNVGFATMQRAVTEGLPPHLPSAAKIVAAFDGDLTFEDLMTADARRAARRVRGRLRRQPDPELTRSAS